MMQPLESFDSSHPTVPKHPPPATPWESVCGWNEEDEIRFVEHEDRDLHSHSQHRFHVPNRQQQKARHVPGPVYFPALIVVW
jgi:hypothetical protein